MRDEKKEAFIDRIIFFEVNKHDIDMLYWIYPSAYPFMYKSYKRLKLPSLLFT